MSMASKKMMGTLDARVNLRLPSGEKETISDDADLAGISVSECVRRRYFGLPVTASADKLMIKELRRIGGLLKAVHLESNGAYSNQTAEALSQVSQYITQLSSK